MTRFKLASPKKGIRTRIKIAEYIDTLHKIRNAALDSLDNRAFGELDNFKSGEEISYEDWRKIYLKHEWVEAPEYQCFYNPKNETQLGDVKIRNQLIKGERAYEYKNYKQEMLYVYSYEVWNKYLTSWKLKYSLIEATPIDLSILTSLSKITIEEALFVTLGISPSVLLESGFHNWDLFKLAPPSNKEITFKDYKGKNFKTSTGINNVVEDKLIDTTEWKILIREFNSKQINTKDFINWAIKNEYIEEDKSLYRNVENSPFTEEFAKSLYDELTFAGFINRSFNELWKWHARLNLLHYLTNELQRVGLIKAKDRFKNIQAYIEYNSPTPLHKQTQPEAYNDKTGKKCTSPDDYKVDKVIANLLKKNRHL